MQTRVEDSTWNGFNTSLPWRINWLHQLPTLGTAARCKTSFLHAWNSFTTEDSVKAPVVRNWYTKYSSDAWSCSSQHIHCVLITMTCHQNLPSISVIFAKQKYANELNSTYTEILTDTMIESNTYTDKKWISLCSYWSAWFHKRRMNKRSTRIW